MAQIRKIPIQACADVGFVLLNQKAADVNPPYKFEDD